MTELAQHFTGTPVIIAPHLKGGIPRYDIVDGERVEVGRIHSMEVLVKGCEQLLVSEELFEEIKKGGFDGSKTD